MSLPLPDNATLARMDAVLRAPQGRRVGVLGLGVAGRAMALHLVRRGAVVVGADRKTSIPSADLLREHGIALRLGEVGEDTLADVEVLVVSPGADPRQPAVQAALARGVPVLGELELVGRLPAKVVAITGTNGKSTTCALAGALLEGCGRQSFVGANFGEPVVSWVDAGAAADVAVLELSSFQLETSYRFAPDVAVVLNVTPDHLDRYDSIEDYALAKQRLLTNMSQSGVAVLSYDDPRVREMAKATRARVWWFATRAHDIPGDGAWLSGGRLLARGEPADLDGFDLSHPRLLGRHNRENAIAALLVARALGIDDRAKLGSAYQGFAGLPHRLELVAEGGGVRFINDSKATNDDAAAIAVQAVDGPILLLVGGRSKGGGYEALLRVACGKVRLAVAFGEAKDEIAAALGAHLDLVLAADLEDAFARAVAQARSGEVVLLAPACSSFDGFVDYTARGKAFAALARAHVGGGR